MLDIEIDGKKLEVAEGSSVMEAAGQAGTFIPHFCYHKKLSIAASCRMCLVEVEKAPKPLPACATAVTNGMKVSTHSEKAVAAQKAVMEFLLINHPLDCPICDQGGECQLQDVAVGYGAGESRYKEEKRVVVNKDLGPLIATDMTRCIHCTRCVRFGQEIAGIMELGVANRGDQSEIMTFVGRTVDSELSGNAIDLCPVGALTSKPFRFGARTWEMSRRRAIAPHDSLGSNLAVQVQHDRVKRVLPLENEAINECWLSDRDRFSYEALASEDRLTRPAVKQGGEWIETDWQAALAYAVKAIRGVIADHGKDSFAVLVSPNATLEEMSLAAKLARALGSANVEFRLRQSDFTVDGLRAGTPWLGLAIDEVAQLDSALVVGSFLRKDHPLLAQRLRQAARRGAKLSLLSGSADDQLMPLANNVAIAPSQWPAALAAVLVKLAAQAGRPIAAEHAALAASADGAIAEALANALLSGERRAVLAGNAVTQHPQYALIWFLLEQIAELASAKFGHLTEAANTVGGYLAGACSGAPFATPRKAYLLVGVEPGLDFADPVAARAAFSQAETVIALSAFRSAVAGFADAMLPISPFTETSGTFVNAVGTAQSFNAVVRPQDETRPGWKVLRVLANLLELEGFEYESSEAIRDEVLAAKPGLSNHIAPLTGEALPVCGLERIADVPIYATDALVRRAPSLQKTADARRLSARIAGVTIAKLGLDGASRVRLAMGGEGVELDLERDDGVAAGCVRVPAGIGQTATLGALSGQITVERV
ncbi:NADH-quinone oxidoreductase subunit NuoG [Niveibacterium terrae]|uniref:NADH-quinone oxidoreductase subunit NuoG n=1 Tax=Niveibacterium terrae TaxID=3373598 RepID=UPI003A90783A